MITKLEDVHVPTPPYRTPEGERYIEETCRLHYAERSAPISGHLLDGE